MEQHVPSPPTVQEIAAQRRQLLVRLGVAGALIIVLLVGLTVYDRLHQVEQSAPGPVAGGTLPGLIPPAPPPAENPLAEAALRRDTPPEPELTSAPEVAPPGQRVAEPPPAEESAPGGRLVLRGEAPPAPVAPAVAEPVPAPAPPAPAPGATPPAKGYRVQLGVFTSSDNAQALLARLEAQGIPAHLESRVVLGPFPTKAEARAAQIRLRKAGEAAGLVVPPGKR